MAPDLIRYDLLVQEALRGVVRNVLAGVADQQLPGEHHCYISFITNAPGVRLSPVLQQRFPHHMTIVLQHQFSDLIVSEQLFEVKLSFGGVPERIVVPFAAIVRFEDPSVGFLLSFEQIEEALQEPEKTAAPSPASPNAALKTGPAAKGSKTGDKPLRPQPSAEASGSKREPAKEPPETRGETGHEAMAAKKQKPADPKIVSIDSFRKKP
jgi:hypothetical protein